MSNWERGDLAQMLTIQGRLPGLNEILNAAKADHGHPNSKGYRWNPYGDMKKKWLHWITPFFKKAHIKPMAHCHASFKWFEPDRRRDPDNIVAGMKFIFDAMVAEKLLPNDGWKQIHGFDHTFEVDPENPRVEVTFTSL